VGTTAHSSIATQHDLLTRDVDAIVPVSNHTLRRDGQYRVSYAARACRRFNPWVTNCPWSAHDVKEQHKHISRHSSTAGHLHDRPDIASGLVLGPTCAGVDSAVDKKCPWPQVAVGGGSGRGVWIERGAVGHSAGRQHHLRQSSAQIVVVLSSIPSWDACMHSSSHSTHNRAPAVNPWHIWSGWPVGTRSVAKPWRRPAADPPAGRRWR
jgi:hypothetical protein